MAGVPWVEVSSRDVSNKFIISLSKDAILDSVSILSSPVAAINFPSNKFRV